MPKLARAFVLFTTVLFLGTIGDLYIRSADGEAGQRAPPILE